MANEIQICDQCNHTRMKTIMPKLRKMAPDAEIKVGCKSYCGPCGKRASNREVSGRMYCPTYWAMLRTADIS